MSEELAIEFLTSKLIVWEEYRKVMIKTLDHRTEWTILLHIWERITETCELINIVSGTDVGTKMMVTLAVADSDWKKKLRELIPESKPKQSHLREL